MNSRTLAARVAISFWWLIAAAGAAAGQDCSQPLNPQFYQDNGYTIRKIELRNPLNFIFLVRQRMERIKQSLPISEGQAFSKANYNAAAKQLDSIVRSDDSFGSSPAKIVVVTAGIEHCQESSAAPKTVEVIYRVFSTDPIPAVRASPEKRQAAVEEPATKVAEDSTIPSYKVRPMLGYEDARHGYGGVDLSMRIPGGIFDDIHLVASGSQTSSILELQLDGSKTPNLTALDKAEYHIAYNYSNLPTSALRLVTGSFQARFMGVSKPMETQSARMLLRYGASVEQGIQQSNLDATVTVSDAVTNSAYGTVRVYAGLTRTSRYSETAISYGLQAGGRGLNNLDFIKHVGDVAFSRRFPGGTHSPWDIQTRFSGGRISGSNGVLLNDRFFGGSRPGNFIPGDAWSIPNGPTVRSFALRRLDGSGLGGTSFLSTNLTIGKVIMSSPIIPRDVEETTGFGSGIESAENTAEQFFADDYLASSAEFKETTLQQSAKLKADLDVVQATLQSIRATETISPALDKVLKDAERQARLSQNTINHASVPDARGRLNSLVLVTFLNPSNSRLLLLLNAFTKMEPLVSPSASSRLAASRDSIKQHLADLRAALDAINTGPVHQKAAARAAHDMARPREIIDTLRREANRFSFSLVGLFDSGRIWPDPSGTRYAIGGGGRFSLVNVNFTAGYAVNPDPMRELNQRRGALFFSITYTDMFR